ncbi:FtsQ-type POTRA domain-containing protein [bacterium]|nr:FtsQ-type POTRA domain-containing protein [bacterium]
MRPLRRLREAASRAVASVARRRFAIVFFLAAAIPFFTAAPLLRYFAAHRYFAVREVEVEGLERLDTAQVLVWLGMGEGSSIWAASPRVLERRLEERPAIAHANVRRIWPDRLHVSVRERAPSAVLRSGSHAFPVDRSGMVFDEQPLRDVDLPIITLGAALPAVETTSTALPAAGLATTSTAKPVDARKAATMRRTASRRSAPDPRDVAEWLPARGDLRQAVRVAAMLEDGAVGIPVSEIGLRPVDASTGRPELVAYSSDGRLVVRLGWGDWQRKIEAVRKVLAHRTEMLRAEAAARTEVASTEPGRKAAKPGKGAKGKASARVEPVPSSPVDAAFGLDGIVDARDPESVVARWSAAAGAVTGTI